VSRRAGETGAAGVRGGPCTAVAPPLVTLLLVVSPRDPLTELAGANPYAGVRSHLCVSLSWNVRVTTA
jgi:hypothetical protein